MLGLSSVPQTLVSWLLHKVAGKYIEDIDSRIKDVSFGPFGGSIVRLQNLNLKPEALVGLDLPIEVKAGHIGLLELRIPAITRIYSDSIVVTVENLLLLSSPVVDRQYDPARDEALKEARKRDTLEKLEQLLQQDQKADGDKSTEGEADRGFIETIKLTALQNLLVTIRNIHIRYEDDITNSSTPFSFGITLEELSLKPYTADKDGITSNTNLSLVNKVVCLKDLSVYWNCVLGEEHLLKSRLNTADWKGEMEKSITETEMLGSKFDYLVEPINAKVDIIINTEKNMDHPAVSCRGNFDHIIVNFKRHMFLNSIILKDSFAMMRVNEKYRMFHPNCKCKGNAKLWWKYAYKSVHESVVKPKLEFWSRIWEYRALYKLYRNLYVKKLLATLTSEKEKAELDEYEMRLNVESIVMARKEAELMYLEQKPSMAVEESANEGIYSRFSNWWSGGVEETKPKVIRAKPTAKKEEWWNEIDKEELYQALNYTKQDDNNNASAEDSGYVKYRLDMKMDGIQLNLLIDARNNKELHVATLYIKDITGALGVRVQGLKFTSSVSHAEIYSNLTGPTQRIYIADVDKIRASQLSEENNSLLYVDVEQYPTDVEADVSIKIKTLPISITYDHGVICAIMAFFHVPMQRYNVGAQLMSIKPEFSTAGLQYAIDNQQRIHVEATLYSPCLIIPGNGRSQNSDSQLIVDLGRIQVNTELRPKNARLENASLDEREALIYDKYRLDILDVMIIFSSPDYTGDQVIEDMRILPDSDMHVMPSLKLTTTVYLSAEPNFTQLPQFKIDSELDRLVFKVSTNLIESFAAYAYKFPQPSAKEYFDKHPLRKITDRSRLPSPGSVGAYDEPDNVISPAGHLMRTELNEEANDILDAVDFEKIQRLEERNIFVTQGDLMNLWFILSKQNNKQSKAKPDNEADDSSENSDSFTNLPDKEGLNAVADLLLDPKTERDDSDLVDGSEALVRLQNFSSLDGAGSDDEKFLMASYKEVVKQLLLPGLDGYSGTEYHTLVGVTLRIKELALQLRSDDAEYLTARINGVTAVAARTTCCTSMRVKLNSFTLADHLHRDANNETLHIACSPESLSMASFEGRFVDDVTKLTFTNVSQAITFHLSTVKLCISDNSIVKILLIVNRINNKLGILNRTTEPKSVRLEVGRPGSTVRSESTLSIMSQQTAFTEADVFYDAKSKFDSASIASRYSRGSRKSLEEKPVVVKKPKRKRKVPLNASGIEIIALDIKCRMASLEIDLLRDTSIIAHLDIKEIGAEYEQKTTHSVLEAKLGSLSLIDSLASIYKNVVVVEEGKKEVMTFHMTQYDQSVKVNKACDSNVKVKLRRLRLVYVNKFISRLTNFFSIFTSGAAVNKVNETSKTRIAASAKNVHKKGTKMLITVEAKTPLVTVPVNDTSNDALLIKLGDLKATNEFVSEMIKEKRIELEQLYDKMNISLTDMAVNRITYVSERNYVIGHSLILPVNMQVTFTRAIPPVSKKCTDINIEASMNQIVIEVSQLDVQMIGQVLYDNVLVSDKYQQAHDVTDVGSTISSAISSSGSTGGSGANGLSFNLNMGGLRLNLKHEKPPTENSLVSETENLAAMDVAELKVVYSHPKKDRTMSCNISLRNFNIFDHIEKATNEFQTNSVIQLDDSADQVFEVHLDMDSLGNQMYTISVEEMRFNVNMPFVKAILTFMSESFTTWKSSEPPPPPVAVGRGLSRVRLQPSQHTQATRHRKVNMMRSRLSVAYGRKTTRPAIRLGAPKKPETTTMTYDLKFGKQSLYMITGDGSLKALVAEVNVNGKASMRSDGMIEAEIKLQDMSVYTTSLRIEQTHLKHQCLVPCSIHVKYTCMPPSAFLKDTIPPKEDVHINMTKIDIKLSTNVIYHALDALSLLTGEVKTEKSTATVYTSNEEDINHMKDIDRDLWLEQYDKDEAPKNVEINPMKAAVQNLVLDEFEMHIEFAVAIGEEFIAILKTRSDLSASVKDWSTKLRAECCFSLDSNYYNESLDVWEPLIEPIYDRDTDRYRRWELMVRLTTAQSHPIAKTDPNEILVDSQELDTFIHHQMSASKEKQRAATLAAAAAEGLRPPVDQVSIASSATDEDEVDTFIAPAGVMLRTDSKKHKMQSPVLRATPVASNQAPVTSTPLGFDTIAEVEEEMEVPTVVTPLLMSAGPQVYITQPSVPSVTKRKPAQVEPTAGLGGVTPTSCVSLAEIADECDAKIDDKNMEPECMCTYLSLISRDKLLINVSPQGLNVISSVIETFTKKPKDSVLFEVYKEKPLNITNLLGIPACISLHKNVKPGDLKLENIRIADNMEIVNPEDTALQQPLRILDEDEDPSQHPLQTFAGLTMPGLAASSAKPATPQTNGRDTIKKKPSSGGLLRQEFHLAIDRYLPIQSISFRRTQSRDFSAQPRNRREDHLCLRVRTQSIHGRKHVSIYSQLKIKNELQYPVEVSYQEISYSAADNGHMSSNISLGIIKPGDWLHIPAVVATLKKLHVKPITPESENSIAMAYSESTESLWWKDQLKLKSVLRSVATMKRTTSCASQPLTCHNQLKQSYTFRALWVPRVCQSAKCSANCPSFDIILECTAEVKNFLPFRLKLDIHVNEMIGSQPTVYELDPGVYKQLNDSISTPRRCDLTIPSYQGTSWTGRIELHDRMSESRNTPIQMRAEPDDAAAHGSMTLEPKRYVSPTLNLYCHVRRKPINGNQTQLVLTFFSSYWLSNTTGINLQFRASGVRASDYVETRESEPILITPSTLSKKIQMRIPGYKWSKAFGVDAAGWVGTINCQKSDGTIKHRFMVETRLSNTQLTKIITIFPMFVIVNNLPYNIMYKEGASTAKDQVAHTADKERHDETDALVLPATAIQAATIWTMVEAGESKPFWPTIKKKPLSVRLKRDGSEETTSAFPANVPQRTLLHLPGETCITADVSGGLGTEYFITLRQYQLGDAAVRIENLTDFTLSFTQGNTDKSSANTISVASCKSWLYYWPNPSGPRKLYWTLTEKKSKLNLAKFSQDDSGFVKLQGTVIYWQSFGDNLQRVLTLSDNAQFQQIVKKKNQKEQATMFVFLALESAALSMINTHCLEISLLSINHSPSKWQVKTEGGKNKWFPLGEKLSALIEDHYAKFSDKPLIITADDKRIEIDLADLKFVEPIQGELRRGSFPGVKIQYQKSDYSMAVQLAINHLQLDNQLPDAIFPVVFHPTKKSSLELLYNKQKPCIQMFVRRQFPIEGSTDTYKKAILSIEPFGLRIDKGYILSLLDFITECRTKQNEEQYNAMMKKYHEEDIEYCMRDLCADTKHKTDHSSGAKIYVEDFMISDIKVRLSFSMLGVPHLADVENTQSSFGGDVVDFLLSSVGMTLTEVTDIEFSLSCFTLSNSVQTTDQLTSDLMTHYKSQAIRQGYVFVLGLDILGNPLGLAKDVSRGLKDFFHSANPLNYNKSSRTAIILGMKSAYGSIVGGIAGAGSKITESIGRGVNTLSFDKNFIRSRLRRMKSQPSNFGGSLILSAKTFGYAVGSGVGGIILQPKRGVQQQGAAGFFKGVGKGVSGIVVKPVGGVFDSVSVLLDGFRRVTQYGTERAERVRPPRSSIPSEGLTRFHPYLADGVDMVDDLSSYRYSVDNVYWAHLELKHTKKRRRVVLATTKNIYMLFTPWHTSQLRILWTVPLEGLPKPEMRNDIIHLSHVGEGDETEERTIETDDRESLKWFFNRLKWLHKYTKATYKSTSG